MQSIDTITDFLTAAGHAAEQQQGSKGARFRIYDLSRRVQALGLADFAAIERNERPFPAPRQQHAWLGIVFWSEQQQNDPYIWFVKLPLDERSLFQHAARQHFLSIIVDALGTDLNSAPSAEQEKRLQDNPYVFQPDEARRAAFHALVRRDLGLPPSIYYEDAQSFFSQEDSPVEWESLGVQGIHDVIARLSHPDQPGQQLLHKRLAQDFLNWPGPIQQTLTEAMEHRQLPAALQNNLLAALEGMFEDALSDSHFALLRATSAQALSNRYQQLVLRLLKTYPNDTDLLLTIGARAWPALIDYGNLQLYLEQLATTSETIFIQAFRDLVMLPELRPLLLNILRKDDLSPVLQDAIQALIAHTRSGQ
ncbi:DUF3549 family protein [Aliidiomarina indica]|uniref:DUF3549 family protein n=1 Tax=Aliidiomarina indica TaxID=2749147 RepID=UPI00188E497F|nr:DUF3549 family protein [Aliidiomarina indica]